MPLPLFRQRTDVGDVISSSAANAQAPAGHPLPSDNPPPYPAPSVQSGSTPGKGYVIFTGNQGGVYYNHEHVNRIVKNDTSTVYMSYPTRRRANDAWQYALAKGFATIGCAQALGRQQLQQLTQESYHLPSSATACLSPMSRDRYYIVMKGIRPGIYGSWVEAAIQVLGPLPYATDIRWIAADNYLIRIGRKCLECPPASSFITNPGLMMELFHPAKIEVIHVPEGKPDPLYVYPEDVEAVPLGPRMNEPDSIDNPPSEDLPIRYHNPEEAPSHHARRRLHGNGTSGHFYVVFTGRYLGIYTRVSHVKEILKAEPFSIVTDYPSHRHAHEAWDYAYENGFTTRGSPPELGRHLDKPGFHRPGAQVYCVSPLTTNRFYAVIKGICPGIYGSWLEAALQIHGVAGAQCRRFLSWDKAQAYFDDHVITDRVERI
ncbi:hypothetical protein DL96DRAFT_1724404 [Flagelloscypha sp. PMI_526]|nr:hypothetical protein DL96DRAFT_1724404 [Flagelloscypha sp. PMI_526]